MERSRDANRVALHRFQAFNLNVCSLPVKGKAEEFKNRRHSQILTGRLIPNSSLYIQKGYKVTGFLKWKTMPICGLALTFLFLKYKYCRFLMSVKPITKLIISQISCDGVIKRIIWKQKKGKGKTVYIILWMSEGTSHPINHCKLFRTDSNPIV